MCVEELAAAIAALSAISLKYTSRLYWVATHFPQWAGFFFHKKNLFFKVGFYKKKIIKDI